MKRQDTIRCFNTSCRKCGASVIFWQGSAGSKVFFDAPVKGKLIKHTCKKKSYKKPSKYIKCSYSEHSTIDPERKSFQCPVCGKIFNKSDYVNEHIKQMKKIDDYHRDFFENALDLLKEEAKEAQNSRKVFEKSHDLKQTKRIIIKKKKKEKQK